MKDKLEVIREKLARIAYTPKGGSMEGYMCAVHQSNDAKEALALLDTLIAELESPELVEKVQNAIHDATPLFGRCSQCESNNKYYYLRAKAAINAIKGI